MQRCYLCGAEIKEGMSFCPACGAHVYKQDTSEWYSPGCPVEIIEQRLIIDGNKQPYVQILFRNIGSQMVEGVTIAIQCLGLNQDVLAGVKTYTYADLCAQRGQTFGHDVSISLPDAQTRACRVHLERITFSDGSTYTPCAPLHLVEHPSYLAFSDGTLPPDFPKNARDTCFTQNTDGWFCVCGCQNLPQETTCWNCGYGIEQVKAAQDLYHDAELLVKSQESAAGWEKLADQAAYTGTKALNAYALQKRNGIYEKETSEYKEKFRQLQLQRHTSRRKKRLRIIICSIILLPLLTIAVLYVRRELYYQEACRFYENGGDLEEAYRRFAKWGDYKESEKYCEEIQNEYNYRYAVASYESENYWSAYYIFTKYIDENYRDSKDYLKSVHTALKNTSGIYVRTTDLNKIKESLTQYGEPLYSLSVVAITEDGLHQYSACIDDEDIKWSDDGTLNSDAIWNYMNVNRSNCSSTANSHVYEENGKVYLNDSYEYSQENPGNMDYFIYEKISNKGIAFKTEECNCALCTTLDETAAS